jgi:serine/threonine protein kinase
MEIPTLGEIFGSPEYISPEQAINSADAVPQSDLYSLGVVLFQMLTGHVPFSSGHPNDIAIRHIQEPPPSPREFNPNVSPEVEVVVMRSIEKEPKDRFQTGAEFVAALRQAVKAGAGG